MHFTWNRVKNQILGEFKSAPAEWFWLCGLLVISLSLPLTRAPSSYWSALSWRFTMSRSMTWWNRPLWPCTFGRTWRKVSLWIAWLRSQCPLPWKPMRSVSRHYVQNRLYLQYIFTNSSSRGQIYRKGSCSCSCFKQVYNFCQTKCDLQCQNMFILFYSMLMSMVWEKLNDCSINM